MTWLHYLMEANLYLAIFYTAYYLFLSNDTHYTLNRAYLLISCVLSFIIPVIQLGFLKHIKPQAPVVQHFNNSASVKLIEITLVPPPPQFTWQDGMFYIYLAGSSVLLLILLFKLYQLVRLTRKSDTPTDASYKLIYLNDSNTAFSFFNFLFIGTKAEGRETIIKHELVHIHQKHSVDIVFIEVLKIINWFNPFIYMLQHSLKAIHEYIADEKTAATETDAITYSTFLVHNAYGLSGSSITHSFFNYNLLKKRIIMLNQKRSGSLARLKYLLAVPICGGLLCASTLAFSKNYGWIDLAPGHMQPTVNTVKADRAEKGVNANLQAAGYTNKGYKYKLNKYIVGNEINFLVIIYEKDGSKVRYAKSAAAPADIKLLSEKYGFTFPSNGKYKLLPPDTVKFMAPVVTKIDTVKTTNHKLPPPPPPSTVKHITDVRLLPPPPAPKVTDVKLLPPSAPVKAKKPNIPPPPPPAATGLKPTTTIKGGKAIVLSIDSEAFDHNGLRDQTPVIVVNGSIYKLKEPLKKGQKLSVQADSAIAYMYSGDDLSRAIQKYGSAAQNGVIYASGKTTISVK